MLLLLIYRKEFNLLILMFWVHLLIIILFLIKVDHLWVNICNLIHGFYFHIKLYKHLQVRVVLKFSLHIILFVEVLDIIIIMILEIYFIFHSPHTGSIFSVSNHLSSSSGYIIIGSLSS